MFFFFISRLSVSKYILLFVLKYPSHVTPLSCRHHVLVVVSQSDPGESPACSHFRQQHHIKFVLMQSFDYYVK